MALVSKENLKGLLRPDRIIREARGRIVIHVEKLHRLLVDGDGICSRTAAIRVENASDLITNGLKMNSRWTVGHTRQNAGDLCIQRTKLGTIESTLVTARDE